MSTEEQPPDLPEGQIGSNQDDFVDNFENMGLKPELVRGIYANGWVVVLLQSSEDNLKLLTDLSIPKFARRAAVQQRVIISVIKGRDVVAHAEAGTGKTATFCISILQKVDTKIKDTQALILSPTREVAQRIQKVVIALGEYLNRIQKVVIALGEYLNVECHVCIGGSNRREDLARLQEGAHVIVGTPGPVYDMISRQVFSTNNVKILCLDEADDMLRHGFRDQMYDIFQFLPQGTQVAAFVRTMPADFVEVTQKFMRDPVHIVLEPEGLTLEGIKQFYIDVDKEEGKLDVLCDLYETISRTQAVIFCNTPRKVNWLTEMLTAREFTAFAMHDDMEQEQRGANMKEFRSGSVPVLIATDPARGIGVQEVSWVINYDLPANREDYIHRIGREGSFGRKRVAINFITFGESRSLREIEHFYDTQIEEMPMNVAGEEQLLDLPEGKIESNRDEIVNSFENMGLKSELLRGILRLWILQKVDTKIKSTQALILSPTREVAQRIQKVVIALGEYLNVECHACIGGSNIREEMARFREGVHVVIGTPGRIYDMINRRVLKINHVKIFCLGEADDLLSRGFGDHVYEIFRLLPQETQVAVLSATMPPDVLELTKKLMHNPVLILFKRQGMTLGGIRQLYIAVEKEERKLDALAKAARGQHEGIPFQPLPILIATDPALSIAVQQVSLVINYDVPANREDYIRRIGRGGSFGRKDAAINLVTTGDVGMLREIEQFYSTQINEMPMSVACVVPKFLLSGLMN
ncbi:translation initiation factor eIF4A [Tulasnella sp. 417]|nr:translation initiation factor eIF4A [Tulasnella sp. 417]